MFLASAVSIFTSHLQHWGFSSCLHPVLKFGGSPCASVVSPGFSGFLPHFKGMHCSLIYQLAGVRSAGVPSDGLIPRPPCPVSCARCPFGMDSRFPLTLCNINSTVNVWMDVLVSVSGFLHAPSGLCLCCKEMFIAAVT